MTDPAKATARQARDLEALLDQIIPQSADGRLPAAGGLGLALGVFAATQADADAHAAVCAGLADLASAAEAEGASGFAELTSERQLAVLHRVSEAQPAFLGHLLIPIYTAYYANPKVVRALGFETWPPHPEGYPLETGDLSLLDPVRARGSRFREV